jgi:plastocyanin
MRGALLPLLLVGLGLGGAAAAAPAQAADVTIQNFQFNPTTVTIAQGDIVTWHYAGPDTNHSVTSDPGQADSWDSDPEHPPSAADHVPGSTFARTFSLPGSFTYFCKVHPSMRGTVKVTGAGGEPPPPSTPADTTAPAITAVKAKGGQTCSGRARHCKPKPTTIRFTLSEDARVRIVAPGRPGATVTRAAHAGANTVKISPRRLPPGRYRLNLSATDAGGNSSPTVHARVTVRRR